MAMLMKTPKILKLMKQMNALKKKLDRELYLERLRGVRSGTYLAGRRNPKRRHK
jgi:hypothetical protein